MTVVVVRVYFTLGRSPIEAMCSLKREQARRERESELRLVNSLQTLLQR